MVPNCTPRMLAWYPWIDRFGLSRRYVVHHGDVYTVEFAEQLARCKCDDARSVLLGRKPLEKRV